jgi:CRISPR system Cascade subunit CasE
VSWIRRKGEQGGFGVNEEALRPFSVGREYFEKRGIRGLHSGVEFQGVLDVTDPAKFYETFTRGIGPAKAFGYGLLVIAPTS